MTTIPSRYRRLIARAAALFLVLTLAGCAASVPGPQVDAFSESLAERTFATGFRNIADRYIDETPVETIALEGMRGVTLVDPALAVDRDRGSIVLRSSGGVVSRYAAPPAEDADAWARLTVRLIVDARAASAEMGAAPGEKIYEAVFDGALSPLDSYSRYVGADEAERNRARRSGFSGIGITVSVEAAGARIRRVLPGSPAEDGRLEPDDVVVRVDGVSIVGSDLTAVSALLRGPEGSTVRLDVARDGGPGKAPQTLSFAIVRRHIDLPTVSARVVDDAVYVRVTGFNSRTAQSISNEVGTLRAGLGARAKGVLIDLRGNPGGLLRQAVRVADLFLVAGKIISTEGRHPDSFQSYSAHDQDIAAGLPVVVLVNGKSASAAEIVAAALQDRERAIVVGTTSYGKGTVQTITRLPNDGELTLTWSRLVTPSGYVLHQLGVSPSVCTSAIDTNAAGVIAAALGDGIDLHRKAAAWRAVGRTDRTKREELRNACPARSDRREVDLQIAERLIDNRDLYRRVIALAQPSTATSD